MASRLPLSYGVRGVNGDFVEIVSLAGVALQLTVSYFEDDDVTPKDLTGFTAITLDVCEGTPDAFGEVVQTWNQTSEDWGVITVDEGMGEAVLTVSDDSGLTPGTTYAFRWLLEDSTGVIERTLFGVWVHKATGIA